MERLTYRGSETMTEEDGWIRPSPEEGTVYSCYSTRKIIERLAEYEDLEEQGLLLRLPCKIGSILYEPIDNQINEYYIIGLRFDIKRSKFMYEVTYHVGLDWYNTTCDFDYINDVVFLTKEEAEQKLKEMECD